MSDASTSISSAGEQRRWHILAVIGIAQLMVVLDLTVMNIALGVASATVTTGQQLGASLLNTIFASAVTSYLAAHAASEGLALSYGYDTAFWWTAGIFAGGAIVGGILLRRGPLVLNSSPGLQATNVREAETESSPAISA